MTSYLITLSLGPVQSLIEAARRTRDLWCGSWLLSEAARAAALVLHEKQPGCLIFPCPDDPDRELRPQSEPGREANIANILRAEVLLPDAAAARELCARAKAAAAARLTDLGAVARGKLAVALRGEVWDAQIGDLLEGFAAWSEIPAVPDGYAQASERLGGTLAARKATRDCRPGVSPATEGLYKSSLDGALETVLPRHWGEEHRARRQLGLSRGEQLDALGVMKRLAGNPEQFTAYSRIAADPWIRGLSAEQQQCLRQAYEPLVRMELATRVTGNDDCYAALPYDAQMLFDFRLENALSAKGEDALEPDERQALEHLRQVMRTMPGAPVPYAAILKADGDRMGDLLSRADSADRSREISRCLHSFASRVRQIVHKHHGHAIYAGGDDVLALVPLNDAMPCARCLADAFHDALAPVADALNVDHPTLSVGLGIGHLMEPLGALRERANRAEKAAKGDGKDKTRNALAIVLGIRSGGELEWRKQWTDDAAFEALTSFTGAYRDGQLPTRAAYDLRAIDLRLAWLRKDTGTTAGRMRGAEVARLLDRARTEGGTKVLSKEIRDLILERARSEPLGALANTLIMARWLSARCAADLGERA